MLPISFRLRTLSSKLITLGLAFTLLIFVYTYTSSGFSSLATLPGASYFTSSSSQKSICSPEAYANGSWISKSPSSYPHPLPEKMTKPEDVLAFAALDGCASSREYWWHLAADKPEQYDRFPGATSYEWRPGSGCGLREWQREQVVKDLVEQGGWMLVGDSVTENHFFSLSCLLYPHIIATPDYNAHPGSFDRAWPQNLYLNPSSPLLTSLTLPPTFNISSTPLITFRRIDLLFSMEELVALHHSLHGDSEPEGFSLFSEEKVWTMSPYEYLGIFLDPAKNYHTMVVSTAGHWTTTMFSGYRDESKADSGYGIDELITFFQESMEHWAGIMQSELDSALQKERSGRAAANVGKWRGRRQVVIRAYLPGHEECHDHREPWTEVQPMRWNWYNWGQIGVFNDVFKRVVSGPDYPDIHYLDIDRPARLRPDAHATGDCLHIMTGAGVLEGWTHYIWHFVTREVR